MNARRCGLRVIRCDRCGGETTLWVTLPGGIAICIGCDLLEQRRSKQWPPAQPVGQAVDEKTGS